MWTMARPLCYRCPLAVILSLSPSLPLTVSSHTARLILSRMKLDIYKYWDFKKDSIGKHWESKQILIQFIVCFGFFLEAAQQQMGTTGCDVETTTYQWYVKTIIFFCVCCLLPSECGCITTCNISNTDWYICINSNCLWWNMHM